jgi:hypothetical protein
MNGSAANILDFGTLSRNFGESLQKKGSRYLKEISKGFEIHLLEEESS